MRKTLVSLVFFTIGFTLAFGQNIQWVETLKVAPGAKFLGPPTSFCISEGEFLIPDTHISKIKVFEKNGNSLRLLKEFDDGSELFNQPRYCFFSQDGSKVGILDYGSRKGFIFGRENRIDFKLLKTFDCKKFGYDIKFTNDGIQTIVSGYITDNEGNPFEVYRINNDTGQIDYLLPAHEKYCLPNYEAYVEEYYRKQTLPSIGIKGFFDIQEDDLFYIWEGNLRIIKYSLRYKTITKIFGHETTHYTKPDGSRLSEFYIKGDFKTTWKLQEIFSYIRHIFVTSENVFVVYETGKNGKDVSTYRLQIYTIEGNFIKDILIPGNPGKQMSFDKASNELYAFIDVTGTPKGELAILKYKISR